MKNIHLIMTGGTIDSTWDGGQDAVIVSKQSNLPAFFKKFPVNDIILTEVCMKDSRALTPEDLSNLLKTVESSESKKIVVTHGLYTLPDTVKYLKKKMKRKDQVIVLTGSTTPLKGFGMSDAGFNLGFAISKVQDLKPGIYTCLNGKVFGEKK